MEVDKWFLTSNLRRTPRKERDGSLLIYNRCNRGGKRKKK